MHRIGGGCQIESASRACRGCMLEVSIIARRRCATRSEALEENLICINAL
jgi:hypothetical protein